MLDFEAAYTKLNAAQRQAVDTIEGPVLVIAGPGSGKTQLLSLRVANILRQTDLSPRNILCLTFTDSAVTTMRQRMLELMGPAAYQVTIHTFHSFGSEIISRHPEYFNQGAILLPADEVVQIGIIQDLLEQLPYDNPLRSFHPEQGLTYLKSVQTALQQIKKAGLTPAAYAALLEENAHYLASTQATVARLGGQTMSLKLLPELKSWQETLAAYPHPSDSGEYPSLATVHAATLHMALDEAESAGSSKPLTAWKSRWLTKDEAGNAIFKEAKYTVHQATVASLYQQYQSELYTRGLYDFDDMILTVQQVITEQPALQAELQETYQYILVDEFQDTNDGQLRLLELLGDAPVHEGRPNLMVVGDDDQGIYRFQGAEVSHILHFAERYRDPTIITLTHNYRSTASILELARTVITQGSNRLETVLPNVEKMLTAANHKLAPGHIRTTRHASQPEEYAWVAAELQRLQAQSHQSEVAIIARHHKELENLLPYLYEAGIPVQYERQQAVFQQAPVIQFLTLARYLVTLDRHGQLPADEYLPEILSYPFWGLDRYAIWQIATTAAQDHRLWIDCLRETEDPKLREIAQILLDLGQQSLHTSADTILAALVATAYGTYYFGQEAYTQSPNQYVLHVAAIRTLMDALRRYQPEHPATLTELLELADRYQKNHLSLTSTVPSTGPAAVTLLTAHKAKGQEFETVIILSCQETTWCGTGRASLLPFPGNLPLAPAGDSRDDQLRLFYVALTRAKRNLYLTSYETDDQGRESLPLSFLHAAPHPEAVALPTTFPQPGIALALPNPTPFQPHERDLLLAAVDNYRLSATHLHTFLNVCDAGPAVFLQRYLLRFPQPTIGAIGYGNAIHDSLRFLYQERRRTGKLPSITMLLEQFTRTLDQQQLLPTDYTLYHKQGRDALTRFYEVKGPAITGQELVEQSFAGDGIVVEGVPLTGKIDKLLEVAGHLEIHDYKTGKSFPNWARGPLHLRLRQWSYQQQLYFYRLLLAQSPRFHQPIAPQGVIEFVETDPQGNLTELALPFDATTSDRLVRLIGAVYRKIITLDFPDISPYTSQGFDGILAFETDLLTEKI